MKKQFFLSLGIIFTLILSSCDVSNGSIARMQKLEEGVDHPTTIEELKDAISKYQKRAADIQIAQGQVGIWYKILGTRYVDKKMYGEAMQCFEKALQFYPNNQNLYYYVGICAGYMSHASLDFQGTGSSEKKQNYLKLAENSYLRALEIEPRFSSVLYAIGVLYSFELGENEKAIPYLEKLLTIEKKHTDGMFALARCYYATSQFQKAVDLYDKIISTTKAPDKKSAAEENKKQTLNMMYAIE